MISGKSQVSVTKATVDFEDVLGHSETVVCVPMNKERVAVECLKAKRD